MKMIANKETLIGQIRALQAGEELNIPNKSFRPAAVRNTVTKLNKQNREPLYIATEKGIIDSIIVKRLF